MPLPLATCFSSLASLFALALALAFAFAFLSFFFTFLASLAAAPYVVSPGTALVVPEALEGPLRCFGWQTRCALTSGSFNASSMASTNG